MPSGFRPAGDGQLPIFRKDAVSEVLFYAPGYLAVVDSASAGRFDADLSAAGSSSWSAVDELRRHAAAALRDWSALHSRPFSPVCLTLYLNEQCDLNCIYCFAAPGKPGLPAPSLTLDAVQAAARLVATNCRAAGRPFVVAFHGGGEPALDLTDMKRLLAAIEAIAREYRLPLFRYIATGGAIPPENAAWLAEHFDLVGLSCDGPADIQEVQRPLRNGKNSTPLVERLVGIVHAAHKPLHIRVTITPSSMQRQGEIAEYICRVLHPQEIHVEQVYHGGRANEKIQLDMEQAQVFVDNYFNAQAVARAYGIPWRSSGSRPGSIHGPYCNLFRDVLHLLPGDGATACFKLTNTASARASNLLIGHYDQEIGRYELDLDLIRQKQAALGRPHPECTRCFNRFHCSRLCPDVCLLETKAPAAQTRCRVQGLLAERMLQETAASWIGKRPVTNGVMSGEVAP